jgi:hypothetical protein
MHASQLNTLDLNVKIEEMRSLFDKPTTPSFDVIQAATVDLELNLKKLNREVDALKRLSQDLKDDLKSQERRTEDTLKTLTMRLDNLPSHQDLSNSYKRSSAAHSDIE